MIERAARAILKARFFDCEPEAYGNDLEAFFAGLDEQHAHEAEFEARAAIEAMRTMSPAMLQAAQAKSEVGTYICSNWGGAYSCLEQMWAVQIDAALAEEQR